MPFLRPNEKPMNVTTPWNRFVRWYNSPFNSVGGLVLRGSVGFIPLGLCGLLGWVVQHAWVTGNAPLVVGIVAVLLLAVLVAPAWPDPDRWFDRLRFGAGWVASSRVLIDADFARMTVATTALAVLSVFLVAQWVHQLGLAWGVGVGIVSLWVCGCVILAPQDHPEKFAQALAAWIGPEEAGRVEDGLRAKQAERKARWLAFRADRGEVEEDGQGSRPPQ